MFSDDIRWRAIVLLHVYGVHPAYVSDVLGPTLRTLQRWYKRFKRLGVVRENHSKNRSSCWPPHVLQGVRVYVQNHPTFYLEELQAHIRLEYPDAKRTSISTICRALNFDLGLTRKVLARAARECVPQEVANYKAKLAAIYSFPEQMLFIDETSKDGRHAFRRYAWSARNTPAVVIHMAGARLIFLPPYAPHLNPIEFGFGRLKAWIQKYANLVFPLYPELW
ncbi:hypothetical protein ATCC90586_010488 [Pythium insidiosum]|nr:hypothetical protein ATCC90586_010488 [Pythium insidiosum]